LTVRPARRKTGGWATKVKIDASDSGSCLYGLQQAQLFKHEEQAENSRPAGVQEVLPELP
jgi:hypothetical protein